MFIKDLLARFEEIQRAKIAEADSELGRGGAKDWDDYRRRVGLIAGRREAVSDLQALVKKFIEDDDEDEING